MTSLTDRLAAHFRARPNVWLVARGLLEIAGFAGWRSRLSDVRHMHHMNIVNRQRRCKRPDGSAYTVSEYVFRPEAQDADAASSAPTLLAAV